MTRAALRARRRWRRDLVISAVVDELTSAGAEVTLLGNRGHVKVRWRRGEQSGVVVCGTTTSDVRAVANARAIARRQLRTAAPEPPT